MGGDAKLLNLWFSLEDLLNSGPEWSLAGLGMYSVAEEELENMNICTVIRQWLEVLCLFLIVYILLQKDPY